MLVGFHLALQLGRPLSGAVTGCGCAGLRPGSSLTEYARELHSCISKAPVLTDWQHREVADIRTDVTREWEPDHDTPEALHAGSPD